MKKIVILLMPFILVIACQNTGIESTVLVSNVNELNEAISKAKPGEEIIMANGIWEDVQIRLAGKGIQKNPITLKAETAGEVIIAGQSDLKLGGEYLVVSGLYFKNGYTPSFSVIEFGLDEENLAFNSRVTGCVIENFNQNQRNIIDLWVQFRGRNNQLDHCFLAGKSNKGPTIRVDLEGNESIKNYHKITNNHFGPRPPKGGPSAETIQIGSSETSMVPSYTLVTGNLFEHCNGEVEVISSKANFNEFRNNVFYKSEGSLVTRHGNYCTLDGNYFIGDEDSENIGGIRLIGTGHWVTNNYFYMLKGQNFRSPLAVMNGIPKSPLNRYIQVTDVVIAHNSWVNCTSPLQFGVGSNLDQRNVLPASEIRSARPVRITVANNLVYNKVGDYDPIVAHDLLDGINFKSNIVNNQGVDFDKIEGLEPKTFEFLALSENIWVPSDNLSDLTIFSGFEFEQISNDLFGESRVGNNSIGAVVGIPQTDPRILDKTKYGPDWYSNEQTKNDGKIHSVNTINKLSGKIDAAGNGDIIVLAAGTYEISSSMKINKSLTIKSAEKNSKATIVYTGEAKTPVFEMNPKAHLTLQNITLRGNKEQYAFASLKNGMSSLYNLTVEDSEVMGFDYILKAYKYSFSEHIHFNSSTFRNCNNGLELSEETEDKGEYNAENIVIKDCHFEKIDENVLDYYRGGYDESTVGGNLSLTNSTFTNCGSSEKNGVLLNTSGIINVDISGNSFINNRIKLVAVLWGAKNNTHSNNNISNSGKIVVEENLKLNLLY